LGTFEFDGALETLTLWKGCPVMDFGSFSSVEVGVGSSQIHLAIGGSGPPLLLLHGFPQTHLMWRGVAPLLAEQFTVCCADLPGQGRSALAADGEAQPYGKRAMAGKLVSAMASLGHSRFAVAGHDRGGRVAYRMALDHPKVVTALAVLDVIPMLDALERADDRMLLSFWPWSLMSQPAPLPERLVLACPQAVVDDSAERWGTAADAFPPEVRRAYADALSDPARVHAICEEFRAAPTVDRAHDEVDRAAGRQIEVPTLVLWDTDGALSRWYADDGGALGIWRRWAPQAQGEPVPGGHFFAESEPALIAERLLRFLKH
jgi:haloacetate dehalogenase